MQHHQLKSLTICHITLAYIEVVHLLQQIYDHADSDIVLTTTGFAKLMAASITIRRKYYEIKP